MFGGAIKTVGKFLGSKVKDAARNSNLGRGIGAFRDWKKQRDESTKRTTPAPPPLNSAPSFETQLTLPKLGSKQLKNPFGGADVSTSTTRGFGS